MRKLTAQTFVAFAALAIVHTCQAEIFLEEHFNDPSWFDQWKQSEHKDQGQLVTPNIHGEARGLMPVEDGKLSIVTKKLERPIISRDRSQLVLQFTALFPEHATCVEAVFKIGKDGAVDPENVNPKTPFAITFGPRMCREVVGQLKLQFSYKNRTVTRNERIPLDIPFSGAKTHLYTLIIHSDDTYEVLFDNQQAVFRQSLGSDFNFLPPQTLERPKPEWWDERHGEFIDDPEDKPGPEWTEEEEILDKTAVKPEDWDTEANGEWVAPKLKNPKWIKNWKPKRIKNPDFLEFRSLPVENPEYVFDDKLHDLGPYNSLSIQVGGTPAGIVLDNVLLTDSRTEAKMKSTEVYSRIKHLEHEKVTQDAHASSLVFEELQKEKEAAMKAAMEAQQNADVKEDL